MKLEQNVYLIEIANAINNSQKYTLAILMFCKLIWFDIKRHIWAISVTFAHRVSYFLQKLSKLVGNEICWYLGWNSMISQVSEFSHIVYMSRGATEIYKGKFLKIQRKFFSFFSSIFWHENDFLSWFKARGWIAEVQTVLWTPISPYDSNVIYHMSSLKYDIICHLCHMSAMTYDIWH